MNKAIIFLVGACGALVAAAAACGDDTTAAGPTDASPDSTSSSSSSSSGGKSSSSSSGGSSSSSSGAAMAMCSATMSAADCPMPTMQKCCGEMPIGTLVCKAKTDTCGLAQLCATDAECPSGMSCNPLMFMGFNIHTCSAGMAGDAGGDATHGDGGGEGGSSSSSSGGDAGDSGSDTGAEDAPSEGG